MAKTKIKSTKISGSIAVLNDGAVVGMLTTGDNKVICGDVFTTQADAETAIIMAQLAVQGTPSNLTPEEFVAVVQAKWTKYKKDNYLSFDPNDFKDNGVKH